MSATKYFCQYTMVDESKGETALGPVLDGRQARLAMLKTWDGSLPQSWFDKVSIIAGRSPFGHIVWCYDPTPDGPCIGGYPVAVTDEGDWIMACLAGRALSQAWNTPTGTRTVGPNLALDA